MAQFTANSTRIDPFKNFKFLVKFEGNPDPVAGVSKVSPLKRTTQVVDHREGGDVSTPRRSPGMTAFEPITLERGVTFDSSFQDWANLVYSTEGDGAVSLAGYKRNLVIEVLNLQGVPVKAYKIFRAWVSEFTALPELDSNANATMIESVVIQNEGWEQDDSVVEEMET